jgi:Arc/MetJ-type ribon-helix-helix transcriptional regulator
MEGISMPMIGHYVNESEYIRFANLSTDEKKGIRTEMRAQLMRKVEEIERAKGRLAAEFEHTEA